MPVKLSTIAVRLAQTGILAGLSIWGGPVRADPALAVAPVPESALRASLPPLTAEALRWRQALIQVGIYNESGPVRYMLPLTPYGAATSSLAVALVPKSRVESAGRAMMLVLRMPLD